MDASRSGVRRRRDRCADSSSHSQPPFARRVERHLEWCDGCRKEVAELQEGLSSIPLSLATVEPPRLLEERVVARLLTASGRWKTASRQEVRALVAATLAAVLVAVGALG